LAESNTAPPIAPHVPARFSAQELSLPSPPLGLALVLEAAEDDDASLARLGWLINREPGLTMHVLKLSNSAAYGVGRSVSSVSQATVYLGARTIRNMTLSHIVKTLGLGMDAGAFDATAFWEHSLRRASAGHVLATRIGYDDAGEAFTAGLIQDVGMLAMAVQWPALAAHIGATMNLPAEARRARELALTGVTHDEIFAAIAGEWGVPPTITRAVNVHHADTIAVGDRRGQALGEILRLGDAVADLAQAPATSEALARARHFLDGMRGGKRISLEGLVDETGRVMQEMSSALEIRIRPQPSYEELVRKAQRAMATVSTRYEEETQRLEAMLRRQQEMQRELERKNEQLTRLATTDPLTGLPNRRTLCDRLEDALRRAREYGEPLTVLMIDLDRFKSVNDTYGHDAGDVVLKETAARLKSALRGGDVLGRLGGEEFAVVLPGCPTDGGPYVAERLRILLSVRPMRLPDGTALKVTASIGGTSVAGGGRKSLEEVLKQSDQALYAAKHAGRNRVIWFGSDADGE